MRIFIDDSGDFGWVPAQISLHCAIIVCNSSLVEMFRRHFEWKKSIVGTHRRREIKGGTLKDDELETFVRTVVTPEQDLRLTVVGVDTSTVAREAFTRWRDGLSHLCRGAAQWSSARAFPVAERQYTEMSGWLWNRSPENLAWMMSLGDVIFKSLQNSLIFFHERKFEREFDDFEIVIDHGFIKSSEHKMFWREFFRTYSTNRFRREPLGTPADWHKTGHVFERKYSMNDGQIDLTPLFRDHMYFGDSEKSEGLQIADLCAQICLRYHHRKEWFPAYRLLRDFIVGPQGSPMTILMPEGELDLNSTPPNKTQQEVFEYAKQMRPRLRKG